jgi:glycosyltransferase involved in cell wall biosynthesis
MTTLPAGVYDEMFTHADGARIRRQNSLNGCPLVVYTGVMDHFQRMDYLFQAMQQVIQAVPEARLLIMGNLVQNATPFYQMVQDLGIAEQVTFLLNQPLSELPHCLAAADVTVISRPDTPGFPVKLLNYMSAGKPTVTFQGSAKGVAHLFNGIVVPDHDVQALGAGIVQLLRDSDLRQRLGARAREVVKSNFYWDLLAEIIEQIYETMLRTRTTYRILHPMEMELRQDLGRPIIFYDRRKNGGFPSIPTSWSADLPDRRKSAEDRRKSQHPINFPNRRRLVEPLK